MKGQVSGATSADELAAVESATPRVPKKRSHSRTASWDGLRTLARSGSRDTIHAAAGPPKASDAASPGSVHPNPAGGGGGNGDGDGTQTWRMWGQRMFWLCLGLRTTPDDDVIRLLVAYAVSASAMLALNKHLARTERFDAIMLVQLQLGASLAVIGVAKLLGKINLTLSVTKGEPRELYAWMTLSVIFAIQLVGSIRTLQTHQITEWYMILHYLTPVAVPLFERHLRITEDYAARPPLTVLVFPVITLIFAVVWSSWTAGVFGPGTSSGAFWSCVWITARVSSVVGTRAAILVFQTPIWHRLLYQTLGAFTVFAAIVTVYPEIVESALERGEKEPLSMPVVLQYALLLLSCGVQVLVAWSRLSILGKTTASTFAILSSVGVMPARLYYSGYRLLEANPHH